MRLLGKKPSIVLAEPARSDGGIYLVRMAEPVLDGDATLRCLSTQIERNRLSLCGKFPRRRDAEGPHAMDRNPEDGAGFCWYASLVDGLWSSPAELRAVCRVPPSAV